MDLSDACQVASNVNISFVLKWGLGDHNVGMKASNRQNVNRSTQFESGGMRDFGLNTTQEEWRGNVKI